MFPTAFSWHIEDVLILSQALSREVKISVYVPHQAGEIVANVPLLISNDGQDLKRMSLPETLAEMHAAGKIKPFLLVGIHCNHDRLFEYGTASQADYKDRGNKAKEHTQFVLTELLPYLREHYSIKDGAEHQYFMGFSLGGLSAMDIVWHHPAHFSRVGAFSPSFWWRSKAYEDGYNEDNDRIMHNLVRAGEYKPSLKFWFEVGSNDETEDRNQNGIIDAIDDIMDMMKELEAKGYRRDIDFVYDEIEGGTHDVQTWEKALPAFFKWAFGK